MNELNELVEKFNENDIYSLNDKLHNVIRTNQGIKITFQYKNKSLFTINLKKNKNRKVVLRYGGNTNSVESVDDMLFIFNIYNKIIERSLPIGKYNFFGDIVKNEPIRNDEYNTTKVIESSCRYWEKIKQLESILGEKFRIRYPLDDQDSELLSILVASFIEKKPCRIGNLHDIILNLSEETALSNIKGASGDFTVILNSGDESVCGISLKDYFKVVFYGPIKVIEYKMLGKTTNGNQYKLLIEENTDTVSSVMYFQKKKDAEIFLKNHEEDFRKAQYSWKNESL